MKRGLFRVFGEEGLGLKAEDLNEYAKVIKGAGLIIPEGVVIATDIFHRIIKEDFEAHFDSLLENGPPLKRFYDGKCPNLLLPINQEILNWMEKGRPYAVRSSQVSEAGGTGIFKSDFFWPTGNLTTDLENLWRSEAVVYASEFTEEADLWRERNRAGIGMAILIFPVIGFHFGEHFLPAISGTAYTSYRGLPTVRTVVGLGTRAVNGYGVIFHLPVTRRSEFYEKLCGQELADTITSQGLETIYHQNPEINNEIGKCFEAFNNFFKQLAELKKHGNFYLEWAAYQGQIFIVQCAAYEDYLPSDVNFKDENYGLLLESKDVAHVGSASCRSVIYVYNWTRENQLALEQLNKTNKDFLLIVPQMSLSELATTIDAGKRLSFCHLSNALAVVEEQHNYGGANHSRGRGATHFTQLCGRSSILFIGGELNYEVFDTVLYGKKSKRVAGITIYKTRAEVMVGTKGFVYIKKTV